MANPTSSVPATAPQGNLSEAQENLRQNSSAPRRPRRVWLLVALAAAFVLGGLAIAKWYRDRARTVEIACLYTGTGDGSWLEFVDTVKQVAKEKNLRSGT